MLSAVVPEDLHADDYTLGGLGRPMWAALFSAHCSTCRKVDINPAADVPLITLRQGLWSDVGSPRAANRRSGRLASTSAIALKTAKKTVIKHGQSHHLRSRLCRPGVLG